MGRRESNGDSKRKGFEAFKLIPVTNVSPITKTHFNLPKTSLPIKLGTKYSNISAYGSYFYLNHYTIQTELKNLIQVHNKKSTHDQAVFILEMWRWAIIFNSINIIYVINRPKDRNYIIISIDL